jgi:CRP-like cAMP-binding protein
MDMTITPIGEFLASVPLFNRLERREVERIAGCATVVDAPRGMVLFRQGDPCIGLHIVMRGQVKLALDTDGGDEKVIELLGPGVSFGEASLFLGQPHIANAEAVCDATMLRLSGDIILGEVRRNPGFSERVIGQLCQRLYQRTLELQGHMTLSGTQRVIAYLLNQSPGECTERGMTLTLSVKKGLIASRLNLTQAHFSRILHELVESDLIDVDGRNVRIHDIDRLQAYAID